MSCGTPIYIPTSTHQHLHPPDTGKLVKVEVAEHGSEHGQGGLVESGKGRQVDLRDVERRRALSGAVRTARLHAAVLGRTSDIGHRALDIGNWTSGFGIENEKNAPYIYPKYISCENRQFSCMIWRDILVQTYEVSARG